MNRGKMMEKIIFTKEKSVYFPVSENVEKWIERGIVHRKFNIPYHWKFELQNVHKKP